MIKKLITAPTIEPVDLDEIKDHVRLYGSNTDHDFYLGGLLKSAISQVENITGRALMTQTWAIVFDSWSEMIADVLPLGQLQSITHIKYNDEDGSEQTVSSDDYLVYGVGTDEGKIIIHSDSGFSYPDLYEKDPITVTFVCGYASATGVPDTIKTAVKLLVESVYHDVDVDNAVDAHLMAHRLWVL